MTRIRIRDTGIYLTWIPDGKNSDSNKHSGSATLFTGQNHAEHSILFNGSVFPQYFEN
jgi:hypothetical protein